MKNIQKIIIINVLLIIFVSIVSCSPISLTLIFEVDGELYDQIIINGNLSNISIQFFPENPSKEGYTFDGWYWDKDEWNKPFTVSSFATISLSSNLRLYSKWTVNQYKISFISNGGSTVPEITAGYNSEIIEPLPIKDNYLFMGWYSDQELTNIYTFTTMPARDVTLYASWQPDIYTITFESNGGSVVETISGFANVVISEPKTPYKQNYIFEGWYINPELTEAYEVSKMPSNNITLYAKWLTYEEYFNIRLNYINKISEGDAILFDNIYSEDLNIISDYCSIFGIDNINVIGTICLIDSLYVFIMDSAESAEAALTLLEGIKAKTMGNMVYIDPIFEFFFLSDKIYEEADYTYIVNGLYAGILSYNGQDAIANVPSNYKGKTVTTLDSLAFINSNTVTKIILPDSLQSINMSAIANCSSLLELYIPSTVLHIDAYSIIDNANLIIMCQSTEKPEGWELSWSNSCIFWGYKEEINTYSFETNGGTSVESVETGYLLTSPVSVKENCLLLGWYENSNLSGEAVTFPYYKNSSTILYAMWGAINYSDFVFEINSDGTAYMVSSYIGIGTEAVIPETYNNLPVIQILNNAFDNGQNLVSIFIPQYLIYINGLFENCISLQRFIVDRKNSSFYSINGVLITKENGSIESSSLYRCPIAKTGEYIIPENITSINYRAFYNCINLTSIVINKNIKYNGSQLFEGCTNLSNLTIDSDNQNLSFIDGILYDKEIRNLIFSLPTKIGELIIPLGVENIEYSALYYCYSLEKIYIPESVIYIPAFAFSNCVGAVIYCQAESQPSSWDTYWNAANNLIIWGYVNQNTSYSFVTNGGSAIDTINSKNAIEEPYTEKAGYVFWGWYDNAEFSGDVLMFPYYNKNNTTLYACWIVYDYSDFSFELNSDGNSYDFTYYSGTGNEIVIPHMYNGKRVTSIRNYQVFDYNAQIQSITIPYTVTSINNLFFSNCRYLENINVDSNPVYIFIDGVLYNKNITDLYFISKNYTGDYVMPSTISFFNYGALHYCNSITSITLSKNIIQFSNSMLYDNDNLTDIYVDADNANLSSSDGVLFNKDMTTLYVFPQGRSGYYTIPSTVINLGDNSFADCNKLTEIIFPSGISEIPSRVFSGCASLISLQLPSTLTTIRGYAFSECSSIKTVIIPQSVTIINDYAFINTYNTVFFCEAETQPAGWENYCFYTAGNGNVIMGADIQSKSYIFNTNGGSSVDAINSIVLINQPITEKENYIFYAWYDNADFNGNPILFPYCAAGDTNLYAKWVVYDYSGFTFSLNDSGTGYSIVSYSGNNTNLIIPHLYNGLPVVSIQDNVFQNNTTVENIYISHYSIDLPNLRFCTSLQNIYIEDNNPKYKSIDGVLYDNFFNVVFCSRTRTEINLSDNITYLFYTFNGYNNLTTIYIPSSVLYIASSCFYNCNENLIIYCQSESLPSSWTQDWNNSNYTVVWGATL